MYYGITIEDTDEPNSILSTIERIKREAKGKKVAVRIVIDPDHDVNDEEYKKRVALLKQGSDMVMALIGDSHDVHKFKDVKSYRRRVR
jgi:pyruvate-formate lyase-activating enzyme